MDPRLQSSYPQVTAYLATLSTEQLHNLALTISKRSAEHNHLDVTKIMQKPAQKAAEELQKLSQEVEEPYLQALGKDENISNDSELSRLFSKARALESLSCALLNENSAAIYEALSSIDPEQAQEVLQIPLS